MTTQGPTTGGLPRATGGALPADRGPGGDAVPVELPRPGERRLALPAIGAYPEPTGSFEGLDRVDVLRARVIIRRVAPGLGELSRDELAEVLLRDGFRRG